MLGELKVLEAGSSATGCIVVLIENFFTRELLGWREHLLLSEVRSVA